MCDSWTIYFLWKRDFVFSVLITFSIKNLKYVVEQIVVNGEFECKSEFDEQPRGFCSSQ